MENVYSPPIGALNEPISVAAQDGVAAAAKGAAAKGAAAKGAAAKGR